MGPIPRKILHPYKLASLVKEGSLSANNQNTNVNIKLLLFNADLPARYGMTIVVKKKFVRETNQYSTWVPYTSPKETELIRDASWLTRNLLVVRSGT